ncbi:MAG: SCO family protein [Caulobacteraceae bacterium]
MKRRETNGGPYGDVTRLRAGGSVLVIVLAALVLAAGCRGPAAPGLTEAPRIGGPFSLVDQSGARVDQRLLLGRWSAVYFGYTVCPDVCTTTLSALGAAQVRLGADARRFQVVFITIDPLRDTPRQLRDYLLSPSFPRPIVGLTGSPDEIAAVAHAYGVYYRRAGKGADYAMDHTSIVYLMNPAGRFDRPLPQGDPAAIAQQIRRAMSGE